MRSRLYLVVFCLSVTQFAAAADTGATPTAASKALNRLSWLVGTWKSNMNGTDEFETWRKDAANSFKGMGYSLKAKDTVVSEKLMIEASDSGLFYISDVAHNPAPVYFKMVRQDSLTTVFENKAHDFPTRIIYRQVTPDSLHARIEGIRKGKEAGFDFIFGRVK